MHIEHLAIWTDDIERLKDFYVRHFNCTVSDLYHNPVKGFTSYFLSFGAGARIEIMKKEGIIPRIKGEITGLAHFALQVGTREDVDNLTALLEKSGVNIYGRPRLTGDGYYESVILDADGNRIELTAEK